MYQFLRGFRDFIRDNVCKQIELKRIERDEYEKPIYTRVNPEVYLFDEIISIGETKMPYIKIYATSTNSAINKILDITLGIFVKNDGIYSYQYDNEGNQLADYNLKPDDQSAWMDAWGIAGKIERELLSNGLKVYPLGQNVDIIPSEDEWVGNGIAQIDVKFQIELPPTPITNSEFTKGGYLDDL